MWLKTGNPEKEELVLLRVDRNLRHLMEIGQKEILRLAGLWIKKQVAVINSKASGQKSNFLRRNFLCTIETPNSMR